MMAGDKVEGPKGEHGSPVSEIKADATSAEAVKPSGLLPKVEIPFLRAKNAIEVLGAIRAGREAPIDKQDISDFGRLIMDFTLEDKREEIGERVKDLDPNATVFALDETIRNATITAPTREEIEEVHEQNPEDITTELAYDLELMRRASEFSENPLTKEQIAEKVSYSEDLHGRFSDEGTLGAARAKAGLKWTKDLPSHLDASLDDETRAYIETLKKIEHISSDDFKMANELFLNVYSEIGQKMANGILTPGAPDVGRKVFEAARALGKDFNKKLKKMELRDSVGIADDKSKKASEKYLRTQSIYYGETSMPKISTINDTDVLKPELTKNVDALIEKLLKDGVITEESLNSLRELSIDDFERFEGGNSEFKIVSDKGIAEGVDEKETQDKIFQALKKDQTVWFFREMKKILPTDFDPERMKSNLAYRDLLSAQPEMIKDVADLAKAVRLSYEINYAYEKNGIEAVGNNAMIVKDMYETLMTKAHGWVEVYSEIESMITGEKGKEYRGIYKCEWDSEGNMTSARPKTDREKEDDKKIIESKEGEDKEWLQGGFLRRDNNHKDEVAIRDHLVQVAKDSMEKYNITDVDEAMARAKIAAFVGEYAIWRMLGRAAHWGSRSSAGENKQFTTIGFQTYITQEAKGGSDTTGRIMRKLLVGADTLDEFNRSFMPGQAGGENFNVGYLDAFSNYDAFYPGERISKVVAGFEAVKDAGGNTLQDSEEHDVIVRVGPLRGSDKYFRDRNLLGANEKLADRIDDIYKKVGKWLYDEKTDDKVNIKDRDELWEQARAKLTERDRNLLDEYNNMPIASFAGDIGKTALKNLTSEKNANFFVDDIPDFFTDDLKGAANMVQGLVDVGEGLMTDPSVGPIDKFTKEHTGRKRIWQRLKQAKDLTMAVLIYRTQHNKEKGLANWNTEDVDSTITTLRNMGAIDERTKGNIEKDIYPKITGPEGKIPGIGELMKIPTVHKFVHVYGRKTLQAIATATVGTLWDLIKYLSTAFKV